MMLKIAVLAPTPIATVKMAISDAMGVCRISRSAYRRSSSTVFPSARSSPIEPKRNVSSARDALVVVLGSEFFEQRQRLGARLDALHRAVRHVRRRLALAIDGFDVGALRDQILNHLDVAARRRVVQGGVALVVRGVHVGVQILDE